MNLKEYKVFGYNLYADFAKVVSDVLWMEINNRGFKIQQIQDRAKTYNSLEEKLKKPNQKPKWEHVTTLFAYLIR